MILVTGGTGLVGKHLKDILPNAVYVGSSNYNLISEYEVTEMVELYEQQGLEHEDAQKIVDSYMNNCGDKCKNNNG